ncbi:ABC transporter permease [Phenylobacterium sp.]|uniref:ABC transporter permease n=1 Tax=Phenylobacterium sp. TaxID=1871053 RepID=UPI00378530D0
MVSLTKGAYRTLVTAVFLFLPAPIVIVIASSFSPTGYLSFPPQGFSLHWYREFLGSSEWISALLTSVLLASATAVITVVVAFLAAQVSARKAFPGRGLFEAAVLLPLAFPHAALAVVMLSLLAAFSLRGTFPGLLLAHVILAIPYAYRPIITALRRFDWSCEEAALILGADNWTVMRRIVIPMLRPAITTALLFSFIISFDEVTITMFLIGPDIATAPVRIHGHIQESNTPVIAAVSTLFIGVTLLSVLALERLVGLELFVSNETSRH